MNRPTPTGDARDRGDGARIRAVGFLHLGWGPRSRAGWVGGDVLRKSIASGAGRARKTPSIARMTLNRRNRCTPLDARTAGCGRGIPPTKIKRETPKNEVQQPWFHQVGGRFEQ